LALGVEVGAGFVIAVQATEVYIDYLRPGNRQVWRRVERLDKASD
jgi:hypothetical protein